MVIVNVMKRKTLNDLYDEYVIKYNGNPKYDYCHFVTTMSNIIFHYEVIRPMIIWWSDWNKFRKQT